MTTKADVDQLRRDAVNAGRVIRKLFRELAAKERDRVKLLILGDRTVLHLENKNAKYQHAPTNRERRQLLKDWKAVTA